MLRNRQRTVTSYLRLKRIGHPARSATHKAAYPLDNSERLQLRESCTSRIPLPLLQTSFIPSAYRTYHTFKMAVTTLEGLPAEILLHICECLECNYMASVAAFARACKYCYFAATALLFRTVKFEVSSRLQHFRDVQKCRAML